jgi:hypothetical protein
MSSDLERRYRRVLRLLPGWAEVASVAGLAVRLHLGGPGTPRRYAWGQALRSAVLAVLLVHAVLAVDVLVSVTWIAIFVTLALGHYRTARVLAALVSLACLAHAPRARSRQAAGTGLRSLTLVLLAAVAGAYRIVTLTGYLHDPHLINVSLAELLIVVAAAALVAPDAARAQAATPAPPPYPHAIAA